MTKKKITEPKREVTKRQLSHWQQQKRRQRLILAIGIVIITFVLVTVSAGWYLGEHQPRQQVVIKVNETEFKMDYFLKMLQYYGTGYNAGFIIGIIDDVVKNIQQNELIRQKGEMLGVEVSDDEVDNELKERDFPLSKDYRDLVRVEMIMSKLIDSYFDQQVPYSAEQKYIMAMFLEGENQVADVSSRLRDGGDFGELAEEFSLEPVSKNESGDLGWQPRGIIPLIIGTAVPEDYAFNAGVGELSEPLHDEALMKSLGYWLIEILEVEEEEPQEAHIRIILLPSEEEALRIKTRLDAGEDFTELAAMFSHHDTSKGKGGELDWITAEEANPNTTEFIFGDDRELGVVSHPIRDDTAITRGGYWLVMVEDEDDNLEISDEDRELLKSQVIDEWIDSLWNDLENVVEDYLSDEQKSWLAEHAARD